MFLPLLLLVKIFLFKLINIKNTQKFVVQVILELKLGLRRFNYHE